MTLPLPKRAISELQNMMILFSQKSFKINLSPAHFISLVGENRTSTSAALSASSIRFDRTGIDYPGISRLGGGKGSRTGIHQAGMPAAKRLYLMLQSKLSESGFEYVYL